ncbi:MAG: hypothetical protein H6738_06540 [Alphaproteobacteria bacterium]|nr:hypothetical protein [Alphaproteobacteria bacterium]MCB9696419.1 hypothetical protein [Alphaproteobacteria bacterium]
MAQHAGEQEESNIVYLVGLLAGGLVLGFGIRSLYWSFGWGGGECLNCDLRKVGFDGIDNLGLLPAADYSIGLVVAGVLILVVLNAGAWRRTGGY